MPVLSAIALALIVLTGMVVPGSAQDYSIQPGDRLEISVLEDPGLNRTVLVRPDGRFSMPLAGTINAAGSTPEQVQALIRRRLSGAFVTPPEVTVALAQVGDPEAFETSDVMSIYILGQVARPGVYEVQAPIDALGALAVAGGTGNFAALSRIQVRRRVPGAGESVFMLDYKSIEDGAVPSTFIELQDGDVIVVPERRLFE